MDDTRALSWRERLALHRPELVAWALYDWANSALFTVVITAVFPIFYSSVVAHGLSDDAKRTSFGFATTLSLLVAALISPPLGALADFRRIKKPLLAVFLTIGVLATAGMFALGEGDVTAALWLFALANVGAAGSFVFYDALLPHVAKDDELDRLSTTGYAVGYLGGGIALLVAIALIQHPSWFGVTDVSTRSEASLPARVGFLLVAVWWAVFSIPLFRGVREPEVPIERDERAGDAGLRVAFTRLAETFRELRTYRQAFLLMIAFLIYNDGIGTIIRMATLFGDERHIERDTMIGAVLLAQFTGAPFTILFGKLAGRIGAKRSILCTLVAYIGITALAYRMETAPEFLAMAAGIGMVQGGAQSLSRSLFASLIPKHKSGEFFGLFSTLEKFAGVLGPLVFTTAATSGAGILSLIAFFVVGGIVLLFVDVAKGRAAAIAAERAHVGDA
ncbi:MAG: MFS transporter [Planctomycetota bacterium]